MEIIVGLLSLVSVGLGGAAAWVWQKLQGTQRQLSDSQHQAGELQNAVERSVRDRDETVRRVKGQAETQLRFASEPLIKDLLEALDNLDRALATPPCPEDAGLRAGIQATQKQLLARLGQHGVTRMDAAPGDDFDPAWQEAIAQQASREQEPGQVLSQWVPGYQLHDRLLRPAKVVLATAPEEPAVPSELEVAADLEVTTDAPLPAATEE